MLFGLCKKGATLAIVKGLVSFWMLEGIMHYIELAEQKVYLNERRN